MKNDSQLQVLLKEQGLDQENAQAIVKAFGGPFEEAGEILADYKLDEDGNLIVTDNTIVVKSEDDTEAMAAAREKRKALKKARTTVENNRKALKEDIVKQGRAIDSIARFVKLNIQPAEQYLEQQEKFAEIKAAERAAALKAERIEKLSAYTDNVGIYDLDSMTEDAFNTLLSDLKAAHEAKVAREKAEREEAERKEAERIAEEKRIREENERLRKEAEAREAAERRKTQRINHVSQLGMVWDETKQAYVANELTITKDQILKLSDADFDKVVADVSAVMDEWRKEAEREEAEKQAEIDAKLAKEREAAEAERKKREALEREKREREEAEAKAKSEAEEAERKALLAPDKDKILQFCSALAVVRKEKLPAVKTKQAQDIVNLIDEMLAKTQDVITKKAEEL